MLSVLLKLLIILVLTPRASTQLLAVKLGYLAVYSMNYHAAETAIYDYIARRHPQSAQCVTDFMSTVMSGLSAKAREGHSIEQLCATAALAGEAIKTILKE